SCHNFSSLLMLLTFSDTGTAARVLTDPENHKLGRLHRRDTDQHDESAIVYIGLGHRRPITSHEIRFLLRRALKHSIHPQSCQEITDAYAGAGPKRFIVWFENDPLCASID